MAKPPPTFFRESETVEERDLIALSGRPSGAVAIMYFTVGQPSFSWRLHIQMFKANQRSLLIVSKLSSSAVNSGDVAMVTNIRR